jgi:hypothetical protein
MQLQELVSVIIRPRRIPSTILHTLLAAKPSTEKEESSDASIPLDAHGISKASECFSMNSWRNLTFSRMKL